MIWAEPCFPKISMYAVYDLPRFPGLSHSPVIFCIHSRTRARTRAHTHIHVFIPAHSCTRWCTQHIDRRITVLCDPSWTGKQCTQCHPLFHRDLNLNGTKYSQLVSLSGENWMELLQNWSQPVEKAMKKCRFNGIYKECSDLFTEIFTDFGKRYNCSLIRKTGESSF